MGKHVYKTIMPGLNEALAYEKFKKVYVEVFDDNGNVKVCGRNKCKELIELSDTLEDGSHGSMDTGIMGTESIKNLYQRLNS